MPSAADRRRARAHLTQVKPPVVDELCSKLAAMEPRAAARELVKALADPARQTAALDHLDDLADEASGIGDNESPLVTALKGVAVPVLIDLIDRDGANYLLLARAIGMLGGPDDERAFEKLVELVGDDDREVRLAAPLGLVFFGDRAVPHLEKLLARDGETGKELKAAGDLPHCVHVVCSCLKHIQSRRSINVLKRAAQSGKYGRFPRDMHLLALRAFDKAALTVRLVALEAKAEARKQAATTPAAKRPAGTKPAAKTRRT